MLQNENSGRLKKEPLQKIMKAHEDHGILYGSPKITRQLRKDGIKVNPRCVDSLMRQSGIKAKTRRKHKHTNISEHNLSVISNLIERGFSCDMIDQKWTGDVTYIWKTEGWSYLSIVLDLPSKRVIGWHMDKYPHKEFVIEALRISVRSRSLWVRNKGELFFHSDQCIHYASDEFKRLLVEYNI